MHVLCFCEKWESGGIESFLVSLFEHMDRTGLTVDLAACRVCPGVYDERLARLGMRVLELGGSIRALNRNVRMFDQLVRAGAYDVVHLNLYEGMGLVFAGVAKKAGVPKVIVHSHNTDLRPSRTRWAKLLVHNCFKSALTRYADDRWAPSRAAAEFLFDGVSRGVRSWTLVKTASFLRGSRLIRACVKKNAIDWMYGANSLSDAWVATALRKTSRFCSMSLRKSTGWCCCSLAPTTPKMEKEPV